MAAALEGQGEDQKNQRWKSKNAAVVNRQEEDQMLQIWQREQQPVHASLPNRPWELRNCLQRHWQSLVLIGQGRRRVPLRS